jgi:hypothetical protein
MRDRMAAGAALAGLLAGLLLAAVCRPPHAQAAACRHVHGPFHMHGSVITGAGGVRYVPYGINATGLSSMPQAGADQAVINAAAQFWCANTVRLQVSQDALVSAAGHVDQAFLGRVETQVAQIESLGMVAVINLQTQTDPSPDFMPTAQAKAFWSSMTAHFGDHPDVVFDLFNEPRNVGTWGFWHSGGWRGGVRYLGMQQLADFARARGARNLLWIQGPHTGGTLAQVRSHQVRGNGPIEYAEHRPGGPHTTGRWDRVFGYLAVRNVAPVVEGEFANYARAGAPWACWDDAPTAIPRWLRYLGSRHIGMIVTRMTKGQLIRSDAMDDPTRLPANFRCVDGGNTGAGHQFMSWFARQNS